MLYCYYYRNQFFFWLSVPDLILTWEDIKHPYIFKSYKYFTDPLGTKFYILLCFMITITPYPLPLFL